MPSPEDFGALYLQGVTPECFNEADLRAWMRNAPAKKPMYASPTKLDRQRRQVPRHAQSRSHRAIRSTSSSPTCSSGSKEIRDGHHRTTLPQSRHRRRRRAPFVTPSSSLGVFRRPVSTTGWRVWVFTVDHKKLGIMYGVAAMFFFIVGGIEALLIRSQLARPNGKVLQRQTCTTRCSRCTPRR